MECIGSVKRKLVGGGLAGLVYGERAALSCEGGRAGRTWVGGRAGRTWVGGWAGGKLGMGS